MSLCQQVMPCYSTPMMRPWLLCALLLLPLACSNRPATVAKPQVKPTTTFYVVRHAERADNSDDAPLSAAGARRAQALAEVLQTAPIRAVYATRYQRTQATVAPAAERLGRAVQPSTPAADQLLERHRGQAVLIAGHSNTVPTLLQQLGVKEEIHLGSGDYGDLFIVKVHGDGVELTTRRFGD